MNIRKINRAIHRDLGYLFAGMAIIYSISGFVLNHRKDFNPNYSISVNTQQISIDSNTDFTDELIIKGLIKQVDASKNYRKHYFPSDHKLKVFLHGGSNIVLNTNTGQLTYENLTKRPVLHQLNFLHYNPGKLYTYFADAFAISLLLLSISGLFILKGKNGITRRGAWFSTIGILIPLILFLMYY